VGNPQFFAEKGNTIFLQVAKIVKKRCLNATASALRESCMNYDPLRHVVGSPYSVLRSINLTSIVRHSSDATRGIVGHALQFARSWQTVRLPYNHQ
jgi:hypothetical protein